MSALGRGLSAAGYAAGEMFAKGALMDQQSELETQRALRLAEIQEQMAARGERRKVELAEESAERSRGKQVARIDAKAGELADEAVGEKRGLIDSGIADRSLWTADQQAAVDQSLAQERKGLMDDSRTREKAAIATGDIGPKDAATIEREQRRLDVTERRDESRAAAAAAAEQRRWTVELAKLDLQQGNLDAQNKKIDAMIQHWERKDDNDEKKAGSPKTPTADRMTSVINSMNQMLKNLDENRPRSTATAEEKADWQRQKDNAIAVRDRATAKLNERFDDDGSAPAKESKPAPKPAATPSASKPISALPKGAKQIGTSGGKPVYETPDGKRYIAQ